MVTAVAPSPIYLKRQLALMVKTVLSRAYLDGVAGVPSLQVLGDDRITGSFVGEDGKIFAFTFDPVRDEVRYNLTSSRKDSDRFDAKSRKKSACQKGISCGLSCIAAHKTCEIKASKLVSPKELGLIRQVSLQLRSPSSPAPVRDYEKMSIRDLQKEARERGIYKANSQNKSQLKETLNLLDRDPDSQERLRRTLENQRSRRQATKQVAPKDLIDTWSKFRKLSKTFGKNPETAALLTAVFLLNAGMALGGKLQENYRNGLPESAQMAMERARKLPVESTQKPNITFTVGGFAGVGSTGQRVKELLETPQDGTAGERWFGKDNHIVPFNHPEFDIPPPSVSKLTPDGKHNPAYLGYLLKEGMGKFVGNYQKGRNEAAVDLAAQFYAYGDRYRKNTVNVLAHGFGGGVADEAVEILSRMRSPDGKGASGSEIVRRLNLVRLGGNHFGFASDKGWKDGGISHRTITSKLDPLASLPKRAAQWISSVKGGEPDDYLKNGEVRDRVREAFGYYSSSLLGRQAAAQRTKESRSAIGEALNVISPAAGALWNQIGKIQERAKENPQAAGILAGALAVGTGAATYNHLKDRYQGALPASALQAQEVLKTASAPSREDGSVTFAVGGAGATASDVAANLPDAVKSSSVVVGFDDRHSQAIPDTNEAAYHAQVFTDGYGKQVATAVSGLRPPGLGETRPDDNDAINLATQLYKQAEHQQQAQSKVEQDAIARTDEAIASEKAVQDNIDVEIEQLKSERTTLQQQIRAVAPSPNSKPVKEAKAKIEEINKKVEAANKRQEERERSIRTLADRQKQQRAVAEALKKEKAAKEAIAEAEKQLQETAKQLADTRNTQSKSAERLKSLKEQQAVAKQKLKDAEEGSVSRQKVKLEKQASEIESKISVKLEDRNASKEKIQQHKEEKIALQEKLKQIEANPQYLINMVAFGTGGLTARRALEILARIKPNGKAIAEQIKFASMGTPSFGLTNNESKGGKYVPQETNFMGDRDPIAKLPHRGRGFSSQVTGVSGHKAKDYLNNAAIQEELLQLLKLNK